MKWPSLIITQQDTASINYTKTIKIVYFENFAFSFADYTSTLISP